MRIHFWCASGNVQSRDATCFEHAQAGRRNFTAHALAPLWPGIDVTVSARLIALFAHVHLQRLNSVSIQRNTFVNAQRLLK